MKGITAHGLIDGSRVCFRSQLGKQGPRRQRRSNWQPSRHRRIIKLGLNHGVLILKLQKVRATAALFRLGVVSRNVS